MKQRIQGIIIGILIAIIFSGITVWAATGTKSVDITYRDIKLYVDGVLITPKDANDNIVEPFIYNGTTYLPVRALSEALGKRVTWDGNTSSVIIGLNPGEVVYFDDILQPYQAGDNKYWWQISEAKGEYILIAGVKYYHGVTNESYNSGWAGYPDTDWPVTGYYNLNAQYSQLSGMYGPSDNGASENLKIDFYGDGRLIKTLEFSRGEMTKDFSIDLTGVLQLKIVIEGHGASIVNWQIK